jgi:hypothetical protein
MIGAFPLKLLASEKIANKSLRWIRGPKSHSVVGDVPMRPGMPRKLNSRQLKTVAPMSAMGH